MLTFRKPKLIWSPATSSDYYIKGHGKQINWIEKKNKNPQQFHHLPKTPTNKKKSHEKPLYQPTKQIPATPNCRCWPHFREMRHTLSRSEKSWHLFYTSLYTEFYKSTHYKSYPLLVTSCHLGVIGQSWTRCLCVRRGCLCDTVFILCQDSWDCWNRCKKTVLICRILLLGNKVGFAIAGSCIHEELSPFSQLCQPNLGFRL